MTWSAKVLLALLLLVPATAAAQDTTPEPTRVPDMTLEEFKPRAIYQKDRGHYFKRENCRDHDRYHFPKLLSEVSPYWRDEFLARWKAKKEWAKSQASRCLPTSMTGIIRYVFPSSTEEAAIRVAYCESRLSPTAYNSSSGAAGLFQFMPFWYAGKWDPFDPWQNTRHAYSLSSAGTNWGPWVCKP